MVPVAIIGKQKALCQPGSCSTVYATAQTQQGSTQLHKWPITVSDGVVMSNVQYLLSGVLLELGTSTELAGLT